MRRALLLLLIGCGAAPPAPAPAPAPIEMGEWRAFSFGAWLAPTTSPVAKDGSITLLWHFHACRAADKDYRTLAANVVIVCINNLGMGTAPYWEAFHDPARFGKLEQEVVAAVAKDQNRPDARVGRTILVAWSAGYASVQQILNVPKYYDETSAVVLLDGLHAGYTKNADGTPTKTPSLDTVGSILHFAEDASRGKKTFVFTHSGVIPPGYASTTEMAHALADRLKMGRTSADPDFPNAIDVADGGDVHVRGFEGGEAKDHISQLHWVTPVLKKWILK